LLAAKIKALESLIKLQNAYVDYVEVGDASAINDLGNFNKKWERYNATLNAYQGQSSETGDLLGSQIEEVTTDLDSTSATFAAFNAATTERTAIFSNFSGK
jgi:hypothetical protein